MENSDLSASGSAGELRRFLADMRHDLRTPISGIAGYSGLLVEDAADAGREELAEELDALRRGGEELLRHVDGLLAESRLDALAEIRPEEIGRELQSASREPLRRILAEAERLGRESGSRPEPASLAEDLGKVRDCARQFEALVSRLAQAPPGAEP